MAKDPAFLFYPGDWLGGTLGMSFEEKGAYLDLLIYQFNKGSFSEKQALSVLKNKEIWEVLKEKFCLIEGLYYNKKLKGEQEKRQNFTESRRQSRTKSDEDNVRIYIVRDNVRSTYKIGSSVNPVRRYNELSNQINPAIMQDIQGNRDLTLIWYSDAVLRSEEKALHKVFKNKHLTGEWFSLNLTDLDIIYKIYSGTLVERTINRTENENENVNTINSRLWFLQFFHSDYSFYKSKFNGQSTTEIKFLEWKKFIDFIYEKRFEELFDCKFLSPHDFAKLENFTSDKWENVLKKILATGIKPEHNLFFRIPEFMNYAKKPNDTIINTTARNKHNAGALDLLDSIKGKTNTGGR